MGHLHCREPGIFQAGVALPFNQVLDTFMIGHGACHCQHLHQLRGQLGAWVSHGNWPLVAIISSVSMYLCLLLMTLASVIVCRHPPPLALSDDVPLTSPYVCVFWTLPPPSI